MPDRFIESPLLRSLGVRHGFSTRLDGVSSPPYDSLNMGDLTGDEAALVAENRRRLAWDLDLGDRTLLVPAQVHGATCALGRARRSGGALPGGSPQTDWPILIPNGHCEADAILGCDPGLALGVLTADCIPMLLSTEGGGWVAAVHGGWRGTAKGILKNAILSLAEASGQPASSFYLAIGPGIGLASYEVGEEVVSACLGSISLGRKEAVGRGMVREVGRQRHLCLKSINRCQGEMAGLLPERIDVLWRDTYAEDRIFFSHRRDRGLTGRHLSVIAPKVDEAGGVNWQR